MGHLPMHGATETELPPEPQQAVRALAEALAGGESDPPTPSGQLGARLRRVVAAHPAFLDGWAHLADWALRTGDDVAAYAYARTGYHRGLDRLRAAGWRGQGAVPWRHEPNRGFLRSVHALALAAGALGEREEVRRCRAFLLELDPDDPLGVARLDPDSG